MRAMALAERHGFPLVTMVDTPGAYPGVAAEQHGQGGAIARSQAAMVRLSVPTVACVIGEGGSGGAVAIAVADRVLMQENAIYSVISPEGCAAILGGTPAKPIRRQRPSSPTLHTVSSSGSSTRSSRSRREAPTPIRTQLPSFSSRASRRHCRKSPRWRLASDAAVGARSTASWASFRRLTTIHTLHRLIPLTENSREQGYVRISAQLVKKVLR